MSYKEQIDKSRIPVHVAIIMDGNGRWAKQRNQHRSYGHQAGVETVRNITQVAAEAGVKYLTLYTFSTENWNRPAEEVAALMTLLLDSIEEEIFMKNNIAFRVIGDMERLPEAVRTRLEQCIERTAGNTRMTMVIALSYSSKWELTRVYFCDTYWPDFNEEEFYKALYDYQQRERRFGKTSEQVVNE